SQDRLVRPAVEAKQAGLPYANLAKAIAAALLFNPSEDEEAVQLQTMLEEHGILYVLSKVSDLHENDDLTQEIIEHYS
ncbi:mannitol-1-phosphate 5-dehydrogenase, partial [Escherichia coli]|nr:mannitol-1-phosphate 5-dehydrogenase [Escherichia coli]